MSAAQKHLNKKAQINLGSFYTPDSLVEIVQNLLKANVSSPNIWTVLDSSCGYGSFLSLNFGRRIIGSDLDKKAIEVAQKSNKKAEYFIGNSLFDINRKHFKIGEDEKLIIVGNPPYNDTTSIIRNNIKDQESIKLVDKDVKTRDFGMSFLLSYNKLKADYVCVLHPLSYLIKKANFSLLKNFKDNYKLIDGVIISSHEFSDTSKSMAFPILIGLYERNEQGMTYEYISNYKFKVKEGGYFQLSKFDSISNYVNKYPNKKYLSEGDKPVAKFWTLRDINALKRNRTFIDSDTYNTVYVMMEKLPYYCYIDVFKKYAEKLPYYVGNCDVFIDNNEFKKVMDSFIFQSLETNSVLKKSKLRFRDVPDAKEKVDAYFSNLFNSKFGFYPV